MWLAKVKKRPQIQIFSFQGLISRIQLRYQPEEIYAYRTDLIMIKWPSKCISLSNQLPTCLAFLVVSVTNLVLCFTGLTRKNGTPWPHGNKGWQGIEENLTYCPNWGLGWMRGETTFRESLENQAKLQSRTGVREGGLEGHRSRNWSEYRRYAPREKGESSRLDTRSWASTVWKDRVRAASWWDAGRWLVWGHPATGAKAPNSSRLSASGFQ